MKTIRLFDDDSVQTEVASDTGNEMTVACMDILEQLELQLGCLVDLRDLDYILTSAVSTFICDVVIRRRLGDGDEKADEVKRHYPRLSNGSEPFGSTRRLVAGSVFDGAISRVGHHWPCESSPTKHCLYDDDNDPAHDHCVFCGDPYERK